MSLHDLFVILNLVVIESILSIDNAAVLSTIVRKLPTQEQSKALNYGITGAYLMRVIALIFASLLIRFWFLKVLGWLYLLYLTYQFFRHKYNLKQGDEIPHIQHAAPAWLRKWLWWFGATIAMIGIVDLSFSIDNVFAAVAMSNKLWIIFIGVLLGIAAIRMFARHMITLMEKHPELETNAFIIIWILWIKLCLSIVEYRYPHSLVSQFLESEIFKYGLWICNLLIIGWPLYIVHKHTRIKKTWPAFEAEKIVDQL